MIYLIHFDEPFSHAKHYLGFCESGGLEARIKRHRSGAGAKLLRAVTQAGIDWSVVRVWPEGTRDQERAIKKKGGKTPICPRCSGDAALRRAVSGGMGSWSVADAAALGIGNIAQHVVADG